MENLTDFLDSPEFLKRKIHPGAKIWEFTILGRSFRFETWIPSNKPHNIFTPMEPCGSSKLLADICDMSHNIEIDEELKNINELQKNRVTYYYTIKDKEE